MTDNALDAAPSQPIAGPLSVPNFRLLWLGQSLSVLGDQFYFVAMPWLALQLSGDPAVVGLVSTVTAATMLVFTLIGGAAADRFSPRAMMLASNITGALIVGGLGVLVALNLATVPLLLLVAALFGVGSAFFEPAYNAIVPHMLHKDQLQSGNAILQGTAQIAGFVGPAMAGLLVAAVGTAWAFGIDALSFIVGAVALLFMTRLVIAPAEKPKPDAPREGFFASIGGGLRLVWADPVLRLLLIALFVINGTTTGPSAVGFPVLAEQYGGAAALGYLTSAFGIGSISGVLLAGALPRPKRLGMVTFGVLVFTGLAWAAVGLVGSLWPTVLLNVLVGVGAGYFNVNMITWQQKRTPPEVMGRVMSVVMMVAMGMTPVSMLLAGFAARWSVPGMFVVSGLTFAGTALAMLFLPTIQNVKTQTA